MAIQDSYEVPQAVRNNAKRGLALRKKYGRGGLDTRQAHEAGVGSGVQRASDLISGSVSYKTIKRMLAFFRRHEVYKREGHHEKEGSASLISWLIWGGDEGYEWAKRIVEAAEKSLTFSDLVKLSRIDQNDDGKSYPKKYFTGLDKETSEKREAELDKRREGKESYKPLAGDDEKTKPSKYSQTPVAKEIREKLKGSSKEEFIRVASEVGGVSEGIIEEVYDRGLKAWATSGHRPGATAQQWAIARVYSFLTPSGKTRKTADKDLWNKHLENKR